MTRRFYDIKERYNLYPSHSSSVLGTRNTVEQIMDRVEEWNRKWARGLAWWHLRSVNTTLLDHRSIFLPSPERRVLVPLCGKAVDLKWLYDAGHTVVGVEGVVQPVLEFFNENDLQYRTDSFSCGTIYKTLDDRLTIYCCDLFALDADTLGKFDAVWDRGSLVAIYEEDRERYARLIRSVLAPDFRYLLSVVQYEPTPEFSGPPRNIPTNLLRELFGDVCQLEVLEHLTDDRENFAEVTLMLTPKY
ncbi:thiopurine S-methyltransferase-like isoform X2 [Macrobrachium nipponense]|uniref:thiopurine S-methyltransferase-like isoform X2 n=1 Tax=Macrobrachium nipponense TaxID=159736 RepID=UPI0030C7ABA3